MKVAFTPLARDDLHAIGEYIATDSKVNAARFVARLRHACLELGEFAERYAIQPLKGAQDVRRRPLGSYSIFYRIRNQQVEILRVVSAARDQSRLIF